MAAWIDPARAPDGMFISTEQPIHSFRTARPGDDVWLVAIGGSFKPGHADEAELPAQGVSGRFDRLLFD